MKHIETKAAVLDERKVASIAMPTKGPVGFPCHYQHVKVRSGETVTVKLSSEGVNLINSDSNLRLSELIHSRSRTLFPGGRKIGPQFPSIPEQLRRSSVVADHIDQIGFLYSLKGLSISIPPGEGSSG